MKNVFYLVYVLIISKTKKKYFITFQYFKNGLNIF